MGEKEKHFKHVAENLLKDRFKVIDKDTDRPWGGFFVINEEQSSDFIENFFDGISEEEIKISGKLSPKILLIEPGKRLSWQYHNRRAELWQIVQGPVGVVRSLTDQQKEMKKCRKGELVKIKQGERHRLVGLEKWAVIAEIWQHVYADHPSDEKDIVRIADDYGR